MEKMIRAVRENAPAEIAAATNAEPFPFDEVSNFSMDIKVGDKIYDDEAKLGLWAKARSGDTLERDEHAAKGNLDDTETKFFARF